MTLNPNAVPNRQFPPNVGLSSWIIQQFVPGFAGYVVDVGASDGISINTTFWLEKELRWNILCIEPNPIFWEKLRAHRAFVATCACDSTPGIKEFFSFEDIPEAYSALRPSFPADFPRERADGQPNGWDSFPVEVKTLDQCLEEAQFPRLDLLCVDVEGNELDVLKGLDFARWKPHALVIESWTGKDEASDYVESLGYRQIGRNVHNNLYVPKRIP